jgi:hypothetical protein
MSEAFGSMVHHHHQGGNYPNEESILCLSGLVDLLSALEPELELQPGLIPLWAFELRRELIQDLRRGA